MRSESNFELTRRIAELNAVAKQLVDESARLRKKAAILRAEYAKVRLGSRQEAPASSGQGALT
jgi:hypothetical protein